MSLAESGADAIDLGCEAELGRRLGSSCSEGRPYLGLVVAGGRGSRRPSGISSVYFTIVCRQFEGNI